MMFWDHLGLSKDHKQTDMVKALLTVDHTMTDKWIHTRNSSNLNRGRP